MSGGYKAYAKSGNQNTAENEALRKVQHYAGSTMEADPVSFSGIGPQGANRRAAMQAWSAEGMFLMRNRSEQVLKCVLDALRGLRLTDTALSENVAKPCVGEYRHLIESIDGIDIGMGDLCVGQPYVGKKVLAIQEVFTPR